ncbi:MAG: SDR family oxidoreductase [Bacteroidetes bacterium]|jgi:short-subunit dehydrogenase|nr:SDR family oxidoreductase [Bacteroidota bacterium]
MNIIITGASKGLGKAFANVFAPHNTLFLCARNINDLTNTANELQQLHPTTTIHYKQVDVSKKTEVIAFGNWCLSLGTPNVLINNAGSFLPGSIHNEADGTIEKMIETNLYSAYHLTRTVVPTMLSNNQGHIFNICSIASVQAYSNGGSYSISKFAMLGFSKNLRQELMPHNIKVTSVLPGAVYTDSWKGSGIDENRIMKDTDIATMVFAASQLSPQACVEEILIRPQLGDL